MFSDEFLKESHICECGQTHKADIKHIEVESGVLNNVPEWIINEGYVNVLVVSDTNTYTAAASDLLKLLQQKNIASASYVFSDKTLAADENSVGRLVSITGNEIDLIVSVGSGTLNDLCKFTAFRLNKPYICVGTAPSMDGYASGSSSMTFDGVKLTVQARCPVAIFCDTDILKEAPLEMIAAGLGDMLGKYTCLCDWQLSQMLFDEYYCEKIVSMMRQALEKCVTSAEGCRNRKSDAIKNLTEGLILSGIAMTYAGSSRPAGGCEHHLSHFWEMRFMQQGKNPVLHGAKVGVATVIILNMYKNLFENTPNWTTAYAQSDNFDSDKWISEMHQHFGSGADIFINSNSIRMQFDSESHKKRVDTIETNWSELKKLCDSILPSPEMVIERLSLLNAPIYPSDLDISDDIVSDSIAFAKYGREKYTFLQLIWDVAANIPID